VRVNNTVVNASIKGVLMSAALVVEGNDRAERSCGGPPFSFFYFMAP
jgi:hypothetical protein